MSRQNPSGIPEDDIINPKLNVSCLDFLLIELVPLAQRITDQLHAREQALIEEFRRSKIFNNSNNNNENNEAAPSTTSLGPAQPTTAVAKTGSTGKGAATETTSAVGTSVIGGVPLLDNEETREAVFWRLDGLGYRVGQGLVER